MPVLPCAISTSHAAECGDILSKCFEAASTKKQITHPLAAAFIQVTAAVHTAQEFHCMIPLALEASCNGTMHMRTPYLQTNS